MRIIHKGAEKTLIEIARDHHQTAADQAITASLNGTQTDLFHTARDGDVIEFFDFSTPLGKETFWHSSAHVLAQAILRLYPDAKPTIGPAIEQGFYYDFYNLSISEHDFKKIEEMVQEVVNENFKPERMVFKNKKEALEAFKDNTFKCELIQNFEEGSPITAYRQGEFFDLCRGPHLFNIGKVRAMKLTKVSGAYWKGDANNPVLTRVYGISFPDKKQLKAYLDHIEEAKKRDHRKLGAELDLYSFHEFGPGMPFFHPRGMLMLNKLIGYWRDLQYKAGYIEIKTPILLNQGLWEQSGHWANYRENMYTTEVEKATFAVKPMNCPGCMLYYGCKQHSYREFPLRVMEFGQVHRHEFSGALSGLFRVRSFVQDDAHIFMREDQIESEILNVLKLVEILYSTFGLKYSLELSTRPEKSIGTDAMWEVATNGLRKALIASGHEFKINEGDGAFYGPKIDFKILDALDRKWQCGTIQLDMFLPERFHLKYTDADGQEKVPVMIHRAILGSIERFLGIMVEHFAGKFPLWISPRQLVIIPVTDRHVAYGESIKEVFETQGFFVDIDSSNESVSKKIRNAQLLQYNYMLILGDKEVEQETLSIRARSNEMLNDLKLQTVLDSLKEEVATKSLKTLLPFGEVSTCK
jgi:threonyl-tRNA synthetase